MTEARKLFTRRDNGYGGIIVIGPCGFYARRSGFGKWVEVRLWRFEWWIASRHFRFRASQGEG